LTNNNTMMWKLLVAVFAALCAAGLAVGMPGGRSDADINSEGVQKALQFAVVQHNQGSNDMYLSQVHRVLKVQTQVVAGLKYYITVEMGKTPCRKGGTEKVCAVHEDLQLAKPFQCTFEVWSRPWLNEIQMTKQTCDPAASV